jgi:Transglutaminase-like superfamily
LTTKYIHKLNTQASGNYWLLIQAMWWLMFYKILLKIVPFRIAKKLAFYLLQSSVFKTHSPTHLAQTAWAVGAVAARWPWRATCMPQALTFKHLLRQEPDLKLVIGVNIIPQNKVFQAHAWVEKNGLVYIGQIAEKFTPIWIFEQ